MFDYFKQLYPKMKKQRKSANYQGKTYYDCKRAANDFQEAKIVFNLIFEKNFWGKWISKPLEEGVFS